MNTLKSLVISRNPPPTRTKVWQERDGEIFPSPTFKNRLNCCILDTRGQKFTNVHEYLTTAIPFGHIHLCINIFIIFTLTVSSLLTVAEMFKREVNSSRQGSKSCIKVHQMVVEGMETS